MYIGGDFGREKETGYMTRNFSELQEERSTMRGKISRPKEEKCLETDLVPHIGEGCSQNGI